MDKNEFTVIIMGLVVLLMLLILANYFEQNFNIINNRLDFLEKNVSKNFTSLATLVQQLNKNYCPDVARAQAYLGELFAIVMFEHIENWNNRLMNLQNKVQKEIQYNGELTRLEYMKLYLSHLNEAIEGAKQLDGLYFRKNAYLALQYLDQAKTHYGC